MRQFAPRVGLASVLSLCSLALLYPVDAQIIPDATLPVNSRLPPHCILCQIDGGTIRGGTLFHSFKTFSIPTGGMAWFNNSSQIQTILTRITGSDRSSIDGLLRANGSANLFFLNPNGIIFGPNARLQIGGSFVASTASYFKFSDGTEFSATNPQAPPLLAINLIPGLQYGNSRPGATIINRGYLAVGQDLILNADQLDLQGQLHAGRDLTLQAQNTVQVRDSLTVPFIAQSGRMLQVQGSQGVDIAALTHPRSGFFSGGDLVLQSDNPVIGDAHYQSGGNVRVEQLSGVAGRLISYQDPIIVAVGDVTVGDYTGASLHILAGGTVTLGNVEITGAGTATNTINPSNPDPFLASLASVPLLDGTTLSIDGSSQPTLDVRAGIHWALVPGFPGNLNAAALSPSFGGAATGATIRTGNIENPGGRVLLTNVYQPNISLAGDIQPGSIDTSQESGIGGSVTLNSRSNLRFVPTSTFAIDTSSSGGNSGAISLFAKDEIVLGGSTSNIFSVSKGATGSGGAITVRAQSLLLAGGAQLNAETEGQGTAGTINIQANTVSLDGVDSAGEASGIFSGVAKGARGNGSNVDLTVGSLSITNGAGLGANTEAQGNAGNVVIQADTVSLDGADSTGAPSGIFSNVDQGAVGTGGNITLTTRSLSITSGAQLNASTEGQGDAGNITIRAETVSLDGVDRRTGQAQPSSVSSSVDRSAVGNGGNVNLTTRSLSITNGAQLSASTEGQGNAGNVFVQADTTVLAGSVDDLSSGIFTDVAPTGVGDGGNLTLTTNLLTVQNQAEASVRSQGNGNAGILRISAERINLLDQGRLRAEATSGIGGDINLQVGTLLLLSGNSEISAISGIPGLSGQDGNIIINTLFLIATPGQDSDITATGFGRSAGSNVRITARGGIFGIQYRTEDTNQSDIIATGTVTVNTPNVDPSQGLVPLTVSLVDPSNQIAAGCADRGKRAGNKLPRSNNQFVVTGRGGVPSTPNEALEGNRPLVDLMEPVSDRQPDRTSDPTVAPIATPSTQIIEAQGWTISPDGTVSLVAQAQIAADHLSWQAPIRCLKP